jgi:hypothetical protein
MAKVQRVNVSQQFFVDKKFKNATAALDSKGVPGGSFTVSDLQDNPVAGVPVPAGVKGMTPITNNGENSETVITLAGNGNDPGGERQRSANSG